MNERLNMEKINNAKLKSESDSGVASATDAANNNNHIKDEKR